MAADWRFDAQELFDDDYLLFYTDILTDEVSDRQTDLIWRVLDLEPGAKVLDLAFGNGRIANRLAGRGAGVTGLDVTVWLRDRAREDARAHGVGWTSSTVTCARLPGRAGSTRPPAYFPEIRDWLLAAGFVEVHGLSGRGDELTIDAPRMVIVAS